MDTKKDNHPVSSVGADERQLPACNEISIAPAVGMGKNNLQPKTCPALKTVDAQSLLQADLPPIQFIVDGLLPQGLYILAGSPKVGKSWLAMLLCHSVAKGCRFWGKNVLQGTALYLALEDSLVRLQTRYRHYSSEGSPNLHFAIRSQTLKDGLTAQVEHFIGQHPDTRLIVIDTLQHIRGVATDKNLYVNDYTDMNILREITSRHDVAVVLVTHTRKMDDADPLNRISGSTGLIGASDGAFILEKEMRTENRGRLTVSNRDTESHVFEVEFDEMACRWNILEELVPQHKDDPLYAFLVAFMADRASWRGTATELSDLAQDYGLGFTSATIAKRIRASEQPLFNKYHIEVRFSSRQNIKHIDLINTAMR